MMLEIEKTQKRLLEVQDALHEAQQDNYWRIARSEMQ